MAANQSENTFFSFVESAIKLAKAAEADAIVVLLERRVNLKKLQKKSASSKYRILFASAVPEINEELQEAELTNIPLDMPVASIQDRLSQAVLEGVAAEQIQPGANVVAVYSSFDSENIDTISILKLTERLVKLTARDLRKLETKVPLDTLKVVVDLAVDIGKEGREGKPVGTMFVVGDHRKVTDQSRPGGFDSMKGYTRKERNLHDSTVREGIKELAQLDGMFIVSADGTVENSARIIDTPPVELTMTTGLGSRHFAGAAISKNTKAIAVVVSQSSGTVRIFQNGEVVLRIEPMQRAMKWKDLAPESQPPREETT